MSAKRFSFLIMVVFLTAGCALWRKTAAQDVQTYQLPYDLVYLTALETLDMHQDWILVYTDKEAGIIDVKNVQYGNIFEVDRQTARYIVKRVNRIETSVEVDPEHSRCWTKSCLNLYDALNTRLRLMPPRVPPQAPPAEPLGGSPAV
jgi:hypothetical protein